jgi:hypothetical protein
MRAAEFITEGNTSLENAIRKMVNGYLNGVTGDKNTCYAYVGQELSRIKPHNATIRFWGRKPKLIVHGDAVLDNGMIISTMPPEEYKKYQYEIVETMSLADLLDIISDEGTNTTIDEMALPPDWDPSAFGHDKSFKSRLEYALARVRRLGIGSSRVAFIIPDNGRDTVLKIAKNKKGLAQNEAEVDILTDGYIRTMDIVIPLVDYDKLNPIPTWLQTELAKKVSRKQLEEMLYCSETPWGITCFIDAVHNIIGKRSRHMPTLKQIKQELDDSDYTEEEIDIFMEYANEVATLVTSSTVLLDDLRNVNNWGEYNGRPVIIDLGYTEEVKPLYQKGR